MKNKDLLSGILKCFLTVALFSFSFCACSQKADWEGMLAPDIPTQNSLKLPKPFEHGKYTITPLANYYITAVVLGKQKYPFDRASSIAPVDLVLAWKFMSVADVVNRLKVSQKVRWYTWKTKGEDYPIQRKDIESSSANVHCLPASKEIKKKLLKLKKYDLVSLTGYLVEVNGKNFTWRSSLSREDTGSGACEVFWITDIVKIER